MPFFDARDPQRHTATDRVLFVPVRRWTANKALAGRKEKEKTCDVSIGWEGNDDFLDPSQKPLIEHCREPQRRLRGDVFPHKRRRLQLAGTAGGLLEAGAVEIRTGTWGGAVGRGSGASGAEAGKPRGRDLKSRKTGTYQNNELQRRDAVVIVGGTVGPWCAAVVMAIHGQGLPSPRLKAQRPPGAACVRPPSRRGIRSIRCAKCDSTPPRAERKGKEPRTRPQPRPAAQGRGASLSGPVVQCAARLA